MQTLIDRIEDEQAGDIQTYSEELWQQVEEMEKHYKKSVYFSEFMLDKNKELIDENKTITQQVESTEAATATAQNSIVDLEDQLRQKDFNLQEAQGYIRDLKHELHDMQVSMKEKQGKLYSYQNELVEQKRKTVYAKRRPSLFDEDAVKSSATYISLKVTHQDEVESFKHQLKELETLCQKNAEKFGEEVQKSRLKSLEVRRYKKEAESYKRKYRNYLEQSESRQKLIMELENVIADLTRQVQKDEVVTGMLSRKAASKTKVDFL